MRTARFERGRIDFKEAGQREEIGVCACVYERERRIVGAHDYSGYYSGSGFSPPAVVAFRR